MRVVSVGRMVKIVSPARLRSWKVRFAVFWRLLEGKVCRREIVDVDRVVAIDLRREESIALMDRNDQMWEVFKNRKGRYVVRRLRERRKPTDR
jgi:hypothetical protein